MQPVPAFDKNERQATARCAGDWQKHRGKLIEKLRGKVSLYVDSAPIAAIFLDACLFGSVADFIYHPFGASRTSHVPCMFLLSVCNVSVGLTVYAHTVM